MKPLVLVPQFFGSMVFDRRTSRYLPFDRESTDLLLRLSDGSTRISLLEDPRQVRFAQHFERLGFFTLDGRFAGEIRALDPPADHLTGPLAVHLEVIGACNLTCTHCFAGELPRNQAPLSLAEMETQFAAFGRIGSFRLGLTGGEPLMRRDLFEIVDAARAEGLHPCLTTNGLHLDERIARELGKRDFLWLNVSLDGANAASNDFVRGPGVFARVKEKLTILREHARFTLAFTLMSTNVREIEDCAKLAEEVGAHTAVFRPLYPVGVAERHPALMPEYRDYADALERLSQLAGADPRGIDPFSPQARRVNEAKVHATHGCAAGHLICSVSVQGDVNPCSFMGREHEAGNVRERPFEAIWSESQKFREVRAMSSAGCEGCFAGGCRARAKAAHGSIDAPDPWHAEYLARYGALDPSVTMELLE